MYIEVFRKELINICDNAVINNITELFSNTGLNKINLKALYLILFINSHKNSYTKAIYKMYYNVLALCNLSFGKKRKFNTSISLFFS